MLNTYIKNKGITKTIIHNNNDNYVNEVNWDADYDGDIANISIGTNSNGIHKQYDIMLDNEDLANILNIKSVNMPLHERLKYDFKDSYIDEPRYIELPSSKFEPKEPKNIDRLFTRHISSPLPNEELIIPLTIDKKTSNKYSLTPMKRHRHKKTHITHKAYKKPKSHYKSKSKTRSKSRTSKKSESIMDFF